MLRPRNDGRGEEPVVATELKAPRAGAIAGILFSILLFTSLVLIRLSVPDSPAGSRNMARRKREVDPTWP